MIRWHPLTAGRPCNSPLTGTPARRMTAATAALSLPRVKAPAPAKPSLPAGLPQLRPFGFQPKFKFTSSVDKVQSQTSSQAASFVRPDVPPVETEQSPRQQFAPAAGAQPRPHGRSALEQVGGSVHALCLYITWSFCVSSMAAAMWAAPALLVDDTCWTLCSACLTIHLHFATHFEHCISGWSSSSSSRVSLLRLELTH